MVREFELPDVGEGLAEAEIVRWLVEPGDRVAEDQPVGEAETDKAVVEIPSPVNGTVREILAEEGEVVPVGTVIITFDVDGETDSADAADEADTDTTATDDAADTETRTGARTFAAPTTRRIARELGVDLGTVEGSGPGGRVTESDVRAAAESIDETTGTAETKERDDGAKSATRRIGDNDTFGVNTEDDKGSSDTEPASSADRDRTLASPTTRRFADKKGINIDSVPTEKTKDGEAFVTEAEIEAYAGAQEHGEKADAEATSRAGEASEGSTAAKSVAGRSKADERIPYRGIRRTIGERMQRSKATAPHATHHDEVDVTALVETRKKLAEHAAERGVDLSYMPFVIRAVTAGLREYPILNAQLDEENEEIVVRGAYNIGIATATEAGLMVPVIEHAGEKGLLQLAEEMNELVSKARDRSIAHEEMQGGTFSITNFGSIGGEYATPIINHPETAILGVGAIKEKPRVVDGEVVPRQVMTLSLSIDHRVIDGAEAARFVNTLKEYLSSPELLLLE